jgi:hypothetical protein
MTQLKLADTNYFDRQRTPLGECLIQLVAVPEMLISTPDEPAFSQQYQDWQDRWSGQQGLIARRLAVIEEELDRLAEERPEMPQSGMFGAEKSMVRVDESLAVID